MQWEPMICPRQKTKKQNNTTLLKKSKWKASPWGGSSRWSYVPSTHAKRFFVLRFCFYVLSDLTININSTGGPCTLNPPLGPKTMYYPMFTHHILVLITMFTYHIWSWLLRLHTIFGPDYYVCTPYLVLITMLTHHIWSWLLWSWLLCLHTTFGPDCYGPDYYVYTPYLVLITMVQITILTHDILVLFPIFRYHIWSWLLRLHTIF